MDIVLPPSDGNCGSSIPADALTDCNGNPSLRVTLCKDDEFVTACAQDNGRIVLVQYTTDETGALTTVVREIDGTISAATPVVCPSKTIEMAPSQIVCVDGVEFTQTPVMDFAVPGAPTQLATVWFNTFGVVVPDPTVGATTVTLGECGLRLDDFADTCTETVTSCSAPLDVSNYYTATNPTVRFDVSNLGGGVYHIGIEDGAFTGAYGLFTTNYATSDFTRLFDDTFFVGNGVQLWNGAISNITSVLSGRRIEFDFNSNALPGNACDTVVAPLSAAAATAFNATVGGATGFVAFLSQNFVLSTATTTVDVLRVKEFCKPTYDIVAPTCAGSVPVTVDSISATYVMNPECPPTPLTLKSGAVSIADGVHAALLGPDGTFWSAPANLKSVTVRARKGTSTDATVSGVNQVIVSTSSLKFVVLLNESWTWEAEDNNILDLPAVTVSGDAAAGIVWVEG